jgi:hypothetical protein
MPEHKSSGSPTKILLATDLTSRGDRALYRSAQLARHTGALGSRPS